METFTFGPPSRQLFGALDGPDDEAPAGLVFCPPFGEEMITSYARLALWSKLLAQKGLAVLRFHPYGTGESDGAFCDFTVDGVMEDIKAAITCLHDRMKVKRVGLFGLRFGAYLAARVAPPVKPDFLMLWSPILDLRQYLRELLRTRLTAEMVHLKADSVRMTTRDMIEAFEAGRTVDILGYEFSPALYRQMTLAPAWPDQPPSPRSLYLARMADKLQVSSLGSGWTQEQGNTRLQLLPEIPFWEEFSSVFPSKFANASEEWLEGQMNG